MEVRYLNEAHRLLSLDAHERNLESIAIVLRQGEESSQLAKDINQMNMDFLDWFVEEKSGRVRNQENSQ
tara:strand:+ start:238 stop:444 length:207 start_codon:yes stop_codon:yes gene_type:complete